MITAKELYRKIKARYPDFRPPKPEPNDFSVRKEPPLNEQQLKLLEMGFPVKPNYDPRFYKDRTDPEETDRFLKAVTRKLEKQPTR